MSTAHTPPDQARKGDEKARERDPHGTGPSGQATKEDPAARPSSDRQKTETAGERTEGKDG